MAKWLVTGAGGFLGANTARVLSRDFEVIGAYHSSPPKQHLFSRTLAVDIRSSDQVRAMVVETRPDVIFHAAAISGHETCEANPELALSVNAGATANLTQIAGELGIRLVYVSTDAVFDGRTGNYKEESPTNPFSVYGETKLLGEKAAAVLQDALIVRTNFFGWSPKGNASILEFFLNGLRRGESIPGYTDFTVTSLYVSDLVRATSELVSRGASGIVHVASSDALSKYAFASQAADTFGLDRNLITPTTSDRKHQGTSRARDISLDTSLCAQLTGASLATQAEGLLQARSDELVVRESLMQNTDGLSID